MNELVNISHKSSLSNNRCENWNESIDSKTWMNPVENVNKQKMKRIGHLPFSAQFYPVSLNNNDWTMVISHVYREKTGDQWNDDEEWKKKKFFYYKYYCQSKANTQISSILFFSLFVLETIRETIFETIINQLTNECVCACLVSIFIYYHFSWDIELEKVRENKCKNVESKNKNEKISSISKQVLLSSFFKATDSTKKNTIIIDGQQKQKMERNERWKWIANTKINDVIIIIATNNQMEMKNDWKWIYEKKENNVEEFNGCCWSIPINNKRGPSHVKYRWWKNPIKMKRIWILFWISKWE